MVLDLQTVVNMYYYVCEGSQYPIDINVYADSLKDTIDFIMNYTKDPLLAEECGRSDILFCIVDILRVVHKDPTNKRFNKVATTIPYELFILLDRTNNEINEKYVSKGLKPKDLLSRSYRPINH